MKCTIDLSKVDSTCQSGISDIVIIDANDVKQENGTIRIKRKHGKFKRVMYKYKQG
jgi:Ni,Fe-hydrogenase maturation factor